MLAKVRSTKLTPVFRCPNLDQFSFLLPVFPKSSFLEPALSSNDPKPITSSGGLFRFDSGDLEISYTRRGIFRFNKSTSHFLRFYFRIHFKIRACHGSECFPYTVNPETPEMPKWNMVEGIPLLTGGCLAEKARRACKARRRGLGFRV